MTELAMGCTVMAFVTLFLIMVLVGLTVIHVFGKVSHYNQLRREYAEAADDEARVFRGTLTADGHVLRAQDRGDESG